MTTNLWPTTINSALHRCQVDRVIDKAEANQDGTFIIDVDGTSVELSIKDFSEELRSLLQKAHDKAVCKTLDTGISTDGNSRVVKL